MSRFAPAYESRRSEARLLHLAGAMRVDARGGAALGITLLLGCVLASSCAELELAGVAGDASGSASAQDAGGGADGSGEAGGGEASGGEAGGGEAGGRGGGGRKSDGASDARLACPIPPPPGGAKPCNVCQDEAHVGCACESELAACLDDPECFAIWSCVIVGVADAGLKPCPIVFSAPAASCVRSCMDLHPSVAAKYFAMESCMYCDYCAKSCDTGIYCAALVTPDAGAGTSVGDASSSGGR